MQDQTREILPFPEIGVQEPPRTDITEVMLHTPRTTDETPASSDSNTNRSEEVLEIVVLADLFEENMIEDSPVQIDPIPQMAKAPSQRKKSIIITINRKGSGETTATDLEQSAIPVPEDNSEISKKIRAQFVRKVMLILLSQLILTSLMVGMVFIPNKSYKDGIQKQPIIALITVIISLLSLMILACKRRSLKKIPWNYILLFIFTASSSYSLAFLASFTESTIVLISAIFTLLIIIGATIFACQSKASPSRTGYFLCQILPLAIALVIAGIVFKSQLAQVAISAGIVFVFSVYLAYDIQRVIGNYEVKYTVDDYILAALDIYIDVYMIFVEVMKLVQNIFKN